MKNNITIKSLRWDCAKFLFGLFTFLFILPSMSNNAHILWERDRHDIINPCKHFKRFCFFGQLTYLSGSKEIIKAPEGAFILFLFASKYLHELRYGSDKSGNSEDDLR
ncbi:hypothetical protein GIT60_22330 [Salmonella enterica]|nr:hypothetical protein [Salmonella enterica]